MASAEAIAFSNALATALNAVGYPAMNAGTVSKVPWQEFYDALSPYFGGGNPFGNNNPAAQTVQTTNGSATTIWTYTPADGETGTMVCVFNAQTTDEGGGPSSVFKSTALFLNVVYKRSGGTATVTGSNQYASRIGEKIYTVSATQSGGTVLVQVTGAASNTVDWIMSASLTKQ